jgi:hypothetical protein
LINTDNSGENWFKVDKVVVKKKRWISQKIMNKGEKKREREREPGVYANR